MPQNIATLAAVSDNLDTVAKLMRVMEKAGVSWEQLSLPINNRKARGNLAAFLKDGCPKYVGAESESASVSQKLGPEPVITALSGIVLPSKGLALPKRIEAGGYDWKNSDITAERFQIRLDVGPCDLVLAHFGVDMEDEAVEAWVKAHSAYADAFTEEILAVGSHPEYRELQRQFPIVARGSSTVVNGNRHVPYLNRNDSKRNLNLNYSDNRWNGNCRFLLRNSLYGALSYCPSQAAFASRPTFCQPRPADWHGNSIIARLWTVICRISPTSADWR